jgi:hypothetical protein
VRLRSKTELAALAALAYGPFLASSPGKVSADSKQDLYLDPGRFLSRATDLWDPHVGAGTVPHQNLGYLFPTGPWFWLLDQIGVPDWVAQRLWLGTITLVALLGARWLFRQLGTGPLGAVAGALVAPQLTLTPGMLDTALVYALAAVILGGLNSPIGVVVAAWAIGILENLAAVYVPWIGYDLKIAVPFILIFVILVLRPQGLFGRKVVVRV